MQLHRKPFKNLSKTLFPEGSGHMKKLLLGLRHAHRIGDQEAAHTLLVSLTLELQAEMTAQERVFLNSFRKLYPFLGKKIFRLLEIHRSIDLVLDDMDRSIDSENDEWSAKIAYLFSLLSTRKKVLRVTILRPLLSLEEDVREWLFRSYRKVRAAFAETFLNTFVSNLNALTLAQ
jgi:hypothetical protein